MSNETILLVIALIVSGIYAGALIMLGRHR
jgi:hypothetical protein